MIFVFINLVLHQIKLNNLWMVKLYSLKPLPNKLLEEAERRGLLDLNSTTKCQVCPAIYPKEYEKCPRCEIEGSPTNFEKIKLRSK